MFKKLTLTIISSFLITLSFAQDGKELVTKEQFAKLQQLSIDFKIKNESNRKKAFELAKQNNWITFSVGNDGSILSLQGVDDLGHPLYLKTFNNTIAAGTTRTNSLYTGGSLGLSLNGSSANLIGKIGIWDGGSILTGHQEFTGGRVEQKDSPPTGSEHATHVAGTIAAGGVYSVARGMAWGLQKLFAYDFNSDITEMTAAASNGMAISNHSYGYIAGWNYNADPPGTAPARWEWYGLFNATEDYKFGFYDALTRDWDIICYNAPYYLPVKSSGNNRSETGPAVGSNYWGYSSISPTVLVDKGNRPSDISFNNSYDIISTTGTAKNILTVGAVSGLPFGSSNPSEIKISSFSSWGPTDDGRIKPDIVADGVNLTSASNADTKSYATLSGTSMSAPNVSGSLVLLQEYYSKLNQGNLMRSATLKGLVIQTADEAGTSVGPDYIFGWGLLNMERAATHIKQNTTTSLISEKSLAQGETQDIQIITSGYGPLKVTICWTDPEGTPTATGTLNSRVPKLVNDLDLKLIKGATTLSPFKLNPDAPTSAATTGDNVVDNVEQIYVTDAIPGQAYTIRVSHKGALTKGPQNYSVLASGIGGKTYCVSTPTSSNDSRIDQFQLSSINNILPNTCRTYTDFSNLSAELEAGKTYPFTVNMGTCGANFDKIAKIFIDYNSDGDFDDANETIATSAIINANGAFTGNLVVPANVISGNSSILRVVLVENTNPALVTSCGNYTKGETQDYRVVFTASSADAGVIALNNINDNLCATTDQVVSIKLKNFGSTTLTNIPVVVTLSSNSTVIKTITENFTGSLAPNNEVDYTLKGVFTTEASKQYSMDARTSLTADVIISNNSSSKIFNVPAMPLPMALSVIACDNAAGFYQLGGQGDGTLFWYPSASSKAPIATGNATYFTPNAPTNNTFYVGLNDYKTFLGAENKQKYNGGSYSGNFGPKPVITVTSPMVLDSALLYVSQSGQLTFTVETTTGTVLNSVTIDVIRTKTTPDVINNGLVDDDINDPGKSYKLGLQFPAAGTYRIGISYNGATIFRSNSGVTNLPMTSPGNIISLSGAYFENAGTPTTITTSYYYLYNMLFKSLGCTDYSRTPVQTAKPIITQTGTTLNSNFNASNKWYLNGTLINGATNQTYSPSVSGVYRVDVENASGCLSSSANFNYVLSAIKPSDAAEIGLKVYPIPANNILNLNFEVLKKENLSINLTNLVGQDVYATKKDNFTGKYSEGIDLSNFDDGVYVLQVKIGEKFYTQKITVVK
ncbi:S8 family serine peptidase [Pedobacter cryophilus]|uniref:T9SS type A sorting domain-containing protein n=1 Tax=Pedobacter cryophilus TaxID=2571271 RepID=A0A4U1BVT0_9SPHI|nr:S8 family serine peptidase [Pedobacter cryophilus]TKB96317.1 T9SS type A sorting domain-containing protein [Pedobacter cryophilus]